jgi:ParB family chromosome partitioning protein
MRTEKFSLLDVKPNPFQTRLAEDPQHIAKLVDSIKKEGLLQMPVGRRTDDGGVELAFGMSRLAAFRKLAKKDEKYTTIPVDVRRISDQRMFELAVRENNDRKDLSPIEVAQAMAKYVDEFEATKAEVAELFGMQPGSVVNKLNLLKLPAEVGALVHSGELQERSARMMLQLGDLNESHAEKVARDIVESNETDWESITEKIADAMRVEAVELSARWDRGRAFGKWWLLDEEFKKNLVVKKAQLKEALDLIAPDGFELTVESDEGEVEIREYKTIEMATLILKGWEASQTWKDMIELYKYPEDAVMLAEHLKNPPKCTACGYHSVIRETHFCAMKPCTKVKKDAKKAAEIHSLRYKKKTKGFKIYDKKVDGKPLDTRNMSWGMYASVQREAFLKALEEKSGDLRLKTRSPSGYPDDYTGSDYAEFVIVGKLKEKIEKKIEKMKEKSAGESHDRSMHWEVLRILREQVVRAAAGPLSDLFGKLKGDDLRLMVAVVAGDVWDEYLEGKPYFSGEEEWKKKDVEPRYRYYIARKMCEQHTYYGMETGEEMVDALEALADVAGVEMPKDWAKDALVVELEEEEDGEQEEPA